MDELIILALQGRATPSQLEELAAWRRASPLHEARFRDLSALGRVLAMHPEIDTTRRPPPVQALLGSHLAVERPGRHSRRRVAGTIAATLLLSVLVGRAGGPTAGPIHETEFHTGSGELATAALDDGTVVRIAPNTRIRVVVSAHGRDVWLEGRAFFAVASDAARPFRVRTSGGVATVLGTRFEVDAREQGLRLLVVDGRVRVSDGARAIELEAGDLSQAATGIAPSITRVASPESLLDWMGAFLAFESTPLWKVAREIESRLGLRIEIRDPDIAARTVTAWFAEEERDEVLRIICRTADVTCDRNGDVVTMEP